MSMWDYVGGGALGESVAGAIGDLWNGITGKTGADAALDAGRIQAAQQDKIIKLFQPFADAGTAMLPQYVSDSSVQGYGKNIGDIINSGALNSLIQQRQDAATSYMAARGLRRSGDAVRQAANIPADLTMQLEQELARRRAGVVNTGVGGIQGAASGLEGVGQALAAGKLGAAQAQAQGFQNLLSIGGILAGVA